MIDVIKNLLNLLKDYKLYTDEFPIDFNFEKVGLYYVLDNCLENDKVKDYDLQIVVASKKENRLLILNEIESINNILENSITNNIWIFKKNVALNHYTEDNKDFYILEYYCRQF